jgi:hypothetical protein
MGGKRTFLAVPCRPHLTQALQQVSNGFGDRLNVRIALRTLRLSREAALNQMTRPAWHIAWAASSWY